MDRWYQCGIQGVKVQTFSSIVHFGPQVFSESGSARKMEDEEDNNKLISADSPEVLKSKSSTLLCPSFDSHEVLKVLTEQDIKLSLVWFLI